MSPGPSFSRQLFIFVCVRDRGWEWTLALIESWCKVNVWNVALAASAPPLAGPTSCPVTSCFLHSLFICFALFHSGYMKNDAATAATAATAPSLPLVGPDLKDCTWPLTSFLSPSGPRECVCVFLYLSCSFTPAASSNSAYFGFTIVSLTRFY